MIAYLLHIYTYREREVDGCIEILYMLNNLFYHLYIYFHKILYTYTFMLLIFLICFLYIIHRIHICKPSTVEIIFSCHHKVSLDIKIPLSPLCWYKISLGHLFINYAYIYVYIHICLKYIYIDVSSIVIDIITPFKSSQIIFKSSSKYHL